MIILWQINVQHTEKNYKLDFLAPDLASKRYSLDGFHFKFTISDGKDLLQNSVLLLGVKIQRFKLECLDLPVRGAIRELLSEAASS